MEGVREVGALSSVVWNSEEPASGVLVRPPPITMSWVESAGWVVVVPLVVDVDEEDMMAGRVIMYS